MRKDILDKFLVEMGDTLRQAKDFTVQQAPEVAKEVLKYKQASCILWLSFGLLILFTGCQIARHLWRKHLKDEYSDYNIGAGVTLSFTFAISVPFILCHLNDLLEIWFAPRLYLIEYFASLARGGCGK